MDQEPHGEDREDLRIGALASVIWNCNVDTKEGMVSPQSYIAGFNKNRDGVFAFYPEKERERAESGKTNINKPGTLDLNDPIGWENFTTGLIKSVGGFKKKG